MSLLASQCACSAPMELHPTPGGDTARCRHCDAPCSRRDCVLCDRLYRKRD